MKIYFFLLLLFFTTPFFAQHYPCATKEPSPETLKMFIRNNNFEHSTASFRNTSLMPVALKVHSVRQTAGTGGVSYEQLALALANINSMFHDSGIEFYYLEEPTYVVNPQYYDFDLSAGESEVVLQGLFTPAPNAVNIYVMNSITTPGGGAAAGYVNFPSAPGPPPGPNLDDPYYNSVYMIIDAMAQTPKSTLAHELGHYFGLLHTFRGTTNGNTDPDAEHVTRTGSNSNCTSAGDLLCDTPADPYYQSGNLNLSNCTVNTTTNDIYGDPYYPSLENLMSYYAVHCGGVFTPDQDARILTWYNARLTHTTYSITGTPQSVNVPTTLNAVYNSSSYYDGTIDLTWNDVASNEVGYIVECSSTSATAGFSAILGAGVGENGITYSHSTFASNATKWYRVKPINGDKDTYSPVAQVTTGARYCTVESSNGYTCGNADEYINRVEFETIDNNQSGCDPSGWQTFTNLSTTVTAGTSYPITVNVVNAYMEDVCVVYADWNRNGGFDDAGEKIVLTAGSGGDYTGNIAVPNNAVAGDIIMRVRLAYDEDPPSCGIIGFGEGEDYVLNVNSILPIELLSFDGYIQSGEAKLNWKTATESNNKEFVIEHSSDGYNFSSIGNVEGQGTSQEVHSYEFVHENLIDGENYYRLLQRDFDGEFSYSKVIVLSKKGEPNLEIFPNPVSDHLDIKVHGSQSADDDLKIALYTSLGQEQIVPIQHQHGNIWNLDTQSLDSGVYFLIVKSGNLIINNSMFLKL